MRNEILLIVMMVVLYAAVLVWYRLFGESGLLCFTVFATIAANIEVLILVEAFGMEMTLGNILFACTFLITDILSEVSGKKMANRAVGIGIATSVLFIVVSQSWLLYWPGGNDWAFPSIQAIFSNTPRLMIASLVVYAIVQAFDVWAYHKWWDFTTRRFGDARRFLWLRNNGSTLISQFLNTLLFTFAAFFGVYDMQTLISIVISSYVIFIVTSLADTPVVYLARRIHEKRRAETA
ncbi:MAG: queuosine precursor transporter [Intestinibacillus sp.]